MKTTVRPFFCALALTLTLGLLGCQSAPRAGSETRAQVTATPTARDQVRGSYRSLHPALRAGVTRADFETGRLAQGECALPDVSAPQGRRWVIATVLLPAGTPSAAGTLAHVDTSAQNGPHRHGRFAGTGPLLDSSNGFVTDTRTNRLATECRPEGAALAAGVVRVRLSGSVPAWQHDFAAAEMARHARFSDADFAAGRVVLLRCQLKVLDGGNWYAPEWLARVPAGLNLRVGDVVRLRAGADEGSKDPGPEPQVLTRLEGERRAQGNALVGCH